MFKNKCFHLMNGVFSEILIMLLYPNSYFQYFKNALQYLPMGGMGTSIVKVHFFRSSIFAHFTYFRFQILSFYLSLSLHIWHPFPLNIVTCKQSTNKNSASFIVSEKQRRDLRLFYQVFIKNINQICNCFLVKYSNIFSSTMQSY